MSEGTIPQPNRAAHASIVFGGISLGLLLASSLPVMFLGAVFTSPLAGVIALVTGVRGMARSRTLEAQEGRGKAKLGIAMGALGVAGSLIVLAIAALVVKAAASMWAPT